MKWVPGATPLRGNGFGSGRGEWKVVRQAPRSVGRPMETGMVIAGRVTKLLDQGAFVCIGFQGKDGLLRKAPPGLSVGDDLRVKVVEIRLHPQLGFQFDLELPESAQATGSTAHARQGGPGQAEIGWRDVDWEDAGWRDMEIVHYRNADTALHLRDTIIATIARETEEGALVTLDALRGKALMRGDFKLRVGQKVVVEVVKIQGKEISGRPSRIDYRVDVEFVREWNGPRVLTRESLRPELAARLPSFLKMQILKNGPDGLLLSSRVPGVKNFVPRRLMGEILGDTSEVMAFKTGVTTGASHEEIVIWCDVNFIPAATALLAAVKGEKFFRAVDFRQPLTADYAPDRTKAFLFSKDYLEVDGFRYRPTALFTGKPATVEQLSRVVFSVEGGASFSLEAPGFKPEGDEWDLIAALANGDFQIKGLEIKA